MDMCGFVSVWLCVCVCVCVCVCICVCVSGEENENIMKGLQVMMCLKEMAG